ncbi:SDR family NAD(P)-dependent oxidoreductase [Winogradskyella vincentii]|uniref:SDR family NAD(P)-dependent oxidoreductase n=1 Tax=Winogradskyella vincentii TaxID=2877122 RepID=A0ABS7Y1K5_9FLAO|nr:SDR family NAD(P)-dependent oxidoreductase [Winogradskyella vincentii]MCA0153135.1 SDR family NAD(P)-dependent oxidoreductase [Winogradskyella vincentii]
MKKAIIIGASTGIGRALAKVLLANNYKVGITGVEKEILKELSQFDINHLKIEYFDCTANQSSAVINGLIKWLGGLDLIVFSAGIGHLDKNLGFTIENEANELNVLAFTKIADKSFRYFEKMGHGHFVAITSIAGLKGNRIAPAYHAAKSYQINYLEGLRHKAKHSNLPITITDIRPGFVDTGLVNKKHFWMATKEKAANQIFSIIKKKKDIGYVTKRWYIIALILKIIPNWLYHKL